MKRHELMHVQFEARTATAVKAMKIEFPAGQKGAYHLHPCPVIGYIISGQCLLQVEGEQAQLLKSGDAFYEPAETPILHFDNYSATDPLQFVAFYLTNGEKELIEMLDGGSNEIADGAK